MAKNAIILTAIVFAAALAVIVGNRLSNEAMAVVIGAVCGISSSIPASVALVIAFSKHWGQVEAPQAQDDYIIRSYAPPRPASELLPMAQPRVVNNFFVVTPGGAARPMNRGEVLQLTGGQPQLPPAFKIIGDGA